MLNNDIVPIELNEKGKIKKDLFKQGHNFWFSACDRDLNNQIINVASGMEDVKILEEKYFTICPECIYRTRVETKGRVRLGACCI